MRILTCEQRSPEWFQAHCGTITSSVIDAVMVEKCDSKTRDDLKWRMVGEIISGKPSDKFTKGFSSRAMENGIETEKFARGAYEVKEGVIVNEVGLVFHPTIERCATSPDSLVGDEGVLEIKCPLRETHLKYLAKDKVPTEYIKQCIWHLVCTRREWVDFVSFSPDLPESMQLFVKRLHVEEDVIWQFEKAAKQFLAEVNGLLIELGHAEVIAQ
jgi:putative phage-type endonuclease